MSKLRKAVNQAANADLQRQAIEDAKKLSTVQLNFKGSLVNADFNTVDGCTKFEFTEDFYEILGITPSDTEKKNLEEMMRVNMDLLLMKWEDVCVEAATAINPQIKKIIDTRQEKDNG